MPGRATREALGSPVALTLVEPLVVEISADVAWTGNAFRHSVRYLHPGPELSPADVVLPDRLQAG